MYHWTGESISCDMECHSIMVSYCLSCSLLSSVNVSYTHSDSKTCTGSLCGQHLVVYMYSRYRFSVELPSLASLLELGNCVAATRFPSDTISLCLRPRILILMPRILPRTTGEDVRKIEERHDSPLFCQ